MDLALNKLQRLICHKTQTNKKLLKSFLKLLNLTCQNEELKVS